uniref:Phosphatidylinositol-glycan biosynthesis class X protein n=1 Tax=Plectus sambesii TaxID=2011161 RepID=A0A914XEG6_9BILA
MVRHYVALLWLLVMAEELVGCKWLNDVTVKSTIDVVGAGMHRQLKLTAHLSNQRRFLECSIAYKLTVPRGAFLDINGARMVLDDGQSLLLREGSFNVEAPMHRSKSVAVDVCTWRPLINSFVFTETWTLPVHLRYHRSVNTQNQSPSVRFDAADVLIRCERDNIFLEDDCRRQMIQAPCDCSTGGDLCSYLNLRSGVGSRPSVVAHVPVGQLSHLLPVTATTVVVVLFCVAYATFVTWFTVQKEKTE